MIGFYDYTVAATYASLLSSVCGIYFALSGRPQIAVYFLMLSGVLDSFDGKIAGTKKDRTLTQKRFGIQVDSLCDLVCFGVLPVVIGYAVGLNRPEHALIFTVYLLAAVIRLAYFNVDEEQRQDYTDEKRRYYEGLPVTATALIFPVVFCFRHITEKKLTGLYAPGLFTVIYALMMAVVAVMFISRFRVLKPGLRGILALIAFGLGILALLIGMSVVYGEC